MTAPTTKLATGTPLRHVLGTEQAFYVRSMGKLLRVVSIHATDDDANAYMAAHDGAAVVACLGPFILTANKWDKGESVNESAALRASLAEAEAHAERLAEAAHTVLFQVSSGPVFERDACVRTARAALTAWRERGSK